MPSIRHQGPLLLGASRAFHKIAAPLSDDNLVQTARDHGGEYLGEMARRLVAQGMRDQVQQALDQSVFASGINSTREKRLRLNQLLVRAYHSPTSRMLAGLGPSLSGAPAKREATAPAASQGAAITAGGHAPAPPPLVTGPLSQPQTQQPLKDHSPERIYSEGVPERQPTTQRELMQDRQALQPSREVREQTPGSAADLYHDYANWAEENLGKSMGLETAWGLVPLLGGAPDVAKGMAAMDEGRRWDAMRHYGMGLLGTIPGAKLLTRGGMGLTAGMRAAQVAGRVAQTASHVAPVVTAGARGLQAVEHAAPAVASAAAPSLTRRVATTTGRVVGQTAGQIAAGGAIGAGAALGESIENAGTLRQSLATADQAERSRAQAFLDQVNKRRAYLNSLVPGVNIGAQAPATLEAVSQPGALSRFSTEADLHELAAHPAWQETVRRHTPGWGGAASRESLLGHVSQNLGFDLSRPVAPQAAPAAPAAPAPAPAPTPTPPAP